VLISIGPFSLSIVPTPFIFPFLQFHLQVFNIGVIFQPLCSITNFLQAMYTKLQNIMTILSLYVLAFYYHYIIAQKIQIANYVLHAIFKPLGKFCVVVKDGLWHSSNQN
jgi:hypothetical protein